MKKLESSLKNMVLVLTIITLCAGGILAGIYSITEGPIEQAKIAKEQNAIIEVLPEHDHLGDAEVIYIKEVGELTLYRAYDAENNEVGGAVKSFSNNGFSGMIEVIVGFDQSGTIINYSVLQQKETPGLGTKIVDWFKTDRGSQNVIGKNAGKANLRVTRDGGEIDAITAATISSRAFLEAIRFAYAAFSNTDVDINSGATSTDANSSATSDVNSGATSTDAGSDTVTDTNSGASTNAADAESGATVTN